MTNVYLIFPDPNDVFSSVRIECTRENLVKNLIETELLSEGDEMGDLIWVIYENGYLVENNIFQA
jgi:hypothetical protein